MRNAATLLFSVLLLATARPSAQEIKNFLWKVDAPGSPSTYLMGSLHVLSADYYPLSARIEQAFRAATVLFEEIDLDELSNPAVALSLMGRAMLPDGRTLDSVIAPALYKKVLLLAEQSGLPAALVQRMRPWMAAVALTRPMLETAGFSASHGVDQHFFDRAKKAGIPRRALETAASQFDRLDQTPAPLQEAMLASLLADAETQGSNIGTIAKAWSQGDIEVIERLLLKEFAATPDLYQRLLIERNRNWVQPVEACLIEKTACFVVVGAAHLVGPDSLVDLLRKRGYVVQQQ